MPHTVSGFDYTCTVLRCIHCWFLQNSASHPVTQACRHHWPCVSQEVWQGWHNIQGQHNTGWQSQAVFSLHCQITPLACYGHIRAALFHLLSPHLCQSVRRLHYVFEKVGNSFLTLRSVFQLKITVSNTTHLLVCWSIQCHVEHLSVSRHPGLANHLALSEELHLLDVFPAEPGKAVQVGPDPSAVAVWEVLLCKALTPVDVIFRHSDLWFGQSLAVGQWSRDLFRIWGILREITVFYEISSGLFNSLHIVWFQIAFCWLFVFF